MQQIPSSIIMSKILDGRVVRDEIAKNLTAKMTKLKTKPKLVIIQVADLAQSNTYITQKKLFGEKIGAIVEHQKYPETITQDKLVTHISSLNTNPMVHGIIVQMPIPEKLDKDEIIEAIDPKKDVDGLTSTNLKILWENRPQGYTPATTKGVITLLNYYKIPVSGKKVVVVGRSSLVGKPTALAFLNKDATVTVCHSKTKKLEEITRQADILIIAAGKPNLIGKEHVAKGQIVVDVGINVITESKKLEDEISTSNLAGDVDFEQVSKIVAAISPVPGGCGPMTVASLFENLLEAYNRQSS